MQSRFRISTSVRISLWIGLVAVFAFVLIQSGWQVSPEWEPILWIGFTILYGFFLYEVLFGLGPFDTHRRSLLQDYQNAWWNQKPILWICIIFTAPLFGSVLGGLFSRRHDTNLWVDVATTYPLLLFLWPALTAPVTSLVILLLLLSTFAPSNRAHW